MCREAVWAVLVCFAHLATPATSSPQVPPFKDKMTLPERAAPSGNAGTLEPVIKVNRSELRTSSDEKGKVVIGSLAEKGHGHVVVVRPGSDRVWDGNTLGGFKDLLAGKEVTNEKVINRMNLFINEGREKKDLDIRKATPREIKEYANRYADRGAPFSHSWGPNVRANVQWYQVSTNKGVNEIVKNYQPPEAKTVADQNLRCNDLVQKVAPIVKELVKEEVGAKEPANANNIDQALHSRSAHITQPVQKSDLGGVLVNPVPQKEDKPLNPGHAENILENRPDGTPVKWPIKLPKKTPKDEEDK